nr:immunoglobulin heavy chain junction region [Macaca mulatta]
CRGFSDYVGDTSLDVW